MIAKRVERRQHSSDYKRLAHYILDRRAGGQKVRDAWSTNCQAPDDFDLAIKEVTATQALNTRSKIDKSYHLVVSLAPGEDLTTEQWKEVETAFCNAIGLSGHQRICAIHADTGHVHLHIAISKIHPEKLTAIEPYYDKFKLQDSCRLLEQTYGLKPGIGDGVYIPPQEAHQGIEAFSSYVREHIAPSLLKLISEPGKKWQDAQNLCGQFGVEIRERAAGLVFAHREEKIFVKASAIDRGFSKAKLESAFGEFESSTFGAKPELIYKPVPIGRSRAVARLYEEYTSLREKEWSEYQKKSENISSERAQKLAEIKARYSKRRQEIKLDTLISNGRKRDIYRKISELMKKEVEQLYTGTLDTRSVAKSVLKTKSWRGFAHERASAGDEVALGVIRSKMPPCKDFGDGAFLGQRNNVIVAGISKEVNADGTIAYHAAGGLIVDYGDALVLKNGGSENALKAALLLARAKFGEEFKLKGPAELIERTGLHIAKSKDPERKIQNNAKDLIR